MTPELWLTLIGALGVPVIVTTFLNFLANKQTLRKTAPKTDAEVGEIETRSQTQIITNLNAEVTRLSLKAESAVRRADEQESQMRRALANQKREFENLLAELEEKYRKENETLRNHNRILTLHVERLTDWAQRNYRDGNADKLGPPPQLKHYPETEEN